MAQLPPIRSPARIWLRELRFTILPRLVFGTALAVVMGLWRSQVPVPYGTSAPAVPGRAGVPRTFQPEGVSLAVPPDAWMSPPRPPAPTIHPALASTPVSTREALDASP